MRSKLAAVASLSLAHVGLTPHAQAMDQGFYIGGYYGSVERDNSDSEDLASLQALSRDVYAALAFDTLSQSSRVSTDDQSFGFMAGFRWTPNLAFEVGYMQLGELEYRSDDVLADLLETPPLVGNLSTRIRHELSSFAISALGIWPLTYEWEIYARAGFSFTNTKAKIRIEDSPFSDSDDSVDLLAGIGLSYTFLDVYTVRGEYLRVFDAGKQSLGPQSDVDLLSIGVAVSF